MMQYTSTPPRVVLYPTDLKPFCLGSESSVYRLYDKIKTRFNIDKEARVTIFHIRDFYNITIQEVIWTIFKIG